MSFANTMSKPDLFKTQDGVLNIIWFSCDGIAFSVAQKLIEEGNNVVIAHIKDKKDIDQKEDKEVQRRRLSLYDGILKKHDHHKILDWMKTIKNKDEWIVFFEFNDLAPIAEEVLKMGFTRGLFPTLEDISLEKDRDKAKDVVEAHYPDLSVAEVQEFNKAEDGIAFLEDTDQLWVLKGNSENAKTLVPQNDDAELAKQILIDALIAHKKDYEDGGFILEEKIIGGYELTPQMVWLDGEVIFTDIDFENKNIQAGNISVQTGAMQTLVVETMPTAKINQIAFPKWIHQKAKEHKGLFIADAGILVKDDQYYFTEFCFQRFGFDSFFAEQEMAGSCTDFFTSIFNGENPLKKPFGIAIRALNMHKDDKERRVLEGISLSIGDPEHTYVFECKDDDGYVCTGIGWDLAVFVGAAKNIHAAVYAAYEALESFAFEDLFYRPKFDTLSEEYSSSLLNRYNELNGTIFSSL